MEEVVIPFIWNNLLNSDDDETSSDDEDVVVLTNNLAFNAKQKKARHHHFLHRVCEEDDDDEFRSNFRLSQEAFNYLLQILTPRLQSMSSSKDVIDPKIELLVTIWTIATPDSFRSMANQFDMPKSSVWVCFERVVKAIGDIAHEFVGWSSQEGRRQLEGDFNNTSKIQGIVGAIDGTYVAIKAPTENPQVYINRKCYHAITLQAICDSKRKFTDIFVGYPSSVGDRRILFNSEIYRNVTTNYNEFFDDNQFIIGDKAYPNLKWLIAPFIDRGNMRDYQKNFNKCHASTRSIIERAFALLFGRFRRLKYLDMSRMDLIPQTVLAACVLHNICLMFPDGHEEEYMGEGQDFLDQRAADINEHVPYNERDMTAEGNERRENIARNLPRQ